MRLTMNSAKSLNILYQNKCHEIVKENIFLETVRCCIGYGSIKSNPQSTTTR